MSCVFAWWAAVRFWDDSHAGVPPGKVVGYFTPGGRVQIEGRFFEVSAALALPGMAVPVGAVEHTDFDPDETAPGSGQQQGQGQAVQPDETDPLLRAVKRLGGK